MRVLDVKEKDNKITIKPNKPVENVIYYLWKNKDKYNIRIYILMDKLMVFSFISITIHISASLHTNRNNYIK